MIALLVLTEGMAGISDERVKIMLSLVHYSTSVRVINNGFNKKNQFTQYCIGCNIWCICLSVISISNDGVDKATEYCYRCTRPEQQMIRIAKSR